MHGSVRSYSALVSAINLCVYKHHHYSGSPGIVFVQLTILKLSSHCVDINIVGVPKTLLYQRKQLLVLVLLG